MPGKVLLMSSITEAPRGREGWFGALARGLRRCCPSCGARGMFTGYLSVAAKCERCGLDFETIRSDDIPPYFTIAIVGHMVVPAVLAVEQIASPPTWLQLAIWLPVTLALTLGILPYIKGAAMGVIWNSKQPG
jgi:uncharacterized protein (DUF983 family)